MSHGKVEMGLAKKELVNSALGFSHSLKLHMESFRYFRMQNKVFKSYDFPPCFVNDS